MSSDFVIAPFPFHSKTGFHHFGVFIKKLSNFNTLYESTVPELWGGRQGKEMKIYAGKLNLNCCFCTGFISENHAIAAIHAAFMKKPEL
ncbi:MAG: hypothetical protein JKY71_02345 [Alphaproteobacteria bacterium]|nr:hypothetical protein [Alphaproteobacteria bacterium]